MLPVILVSNSPRRVELMKHVVTDFQVLLPDYPELLTANDLPDDFVKKNAIGKITSVQANKLPSSCCLIASDTIVVWNHTILGKPTDQEEAINFLQNISGDSHEVFTGVSIRIIERENQVHRYFVEKTTVCFQPLSLDSIYAYVQTKDPLDKAGAYGIQEIPPDWVKAIQGDMDNVVGLPVMRLKEELVWLNQFFPIPIRQP